MRFLLRCILTFNLKTFFIEILPRSRTKRNLQRQRVFLLYHCKRIARWRKSLEEKYKKILLRYPDRKTLDSYFKMQGEDVCVFPYYFPYLRAI